MYKFTLLNCIFFNKLTFSIETAIKNTNSKLIYEKSKKDLRSTAMFSRGSFDEYKGIFNGKVGACFMRLFQFICDWREKVSVLNRSKRREKQ